MDSATPSMMLAPPAFRLILESELTAEALNASVPPLVSAIVVVWPNAPA